MDVIAGISIIGISTSIFLGCLFLLKGKDSLIANRFLGAFFILLAVRLGKLPAQEYGSVLLADIYFNLMHASFLALGPVIWLYVTRYLGSKNEIAATRRNHFMLPLVFLIGAFHLRRIMSEELWLGLYWIIQVHPVLYVYIAGKYVTRESLSKGLSTDQKIWLYSLLGVTILIPVMNLLYLNFNFPFYFITALLVVIIIYFVCFLALNNRVNVLIGKNEQKYQNLNLPKTEVSEIQGRIKGILEEEELYLNDRLRLSDVSDALKIPAHIISRAINEIGGKNFPQYINELRIEKAKEKLIRESDKKVIAVAYESGFRSLSAFNRAFKKNAGINPSEYRLKYSSKN